MGQIAQLHDKRLYLDTNIFIYALEKVEPFLPVCKSIFALIQSAKSNAVTSQLTLAECLVQPYKLQLTTQQQAFKQAISNNPALEYVGLEENTFLTAAQLRAKHAIKMPDALHLAAAILHDCDYFITNDNGIPSLPDEGIERLLLKDFVTE